MTTAGILFMRSDECGMWQGVKSENCAQTLHCSVIIEARTYASADR